MPEGFYPASTGFMKSIFVEGMSYEGLEFGDGGKTIEAYQKMCIVADDPKELAKVSKALLEYCCQDTLAMVRLLMNYSK
jgi:hypothetical protein